MASSLLTSTSNVYTLGVMNREAVLRCGVLTRPDVAARATARLARESRFAAYIEAQRVPIRFANHDALCVYLAMVGDRLGYHVVHEHDVQFSGRCAVKGRKRGRVDLVFGGPDINRWEPWRDVAIAVEVKMLLNGPKGIRKAVRQMCRYRVGLVSPEGTYPRCYVVGPRVADVDVEWAQRLGVTVLTAEQFAGELAQLRPFLFVAERAVAS